MPSCLGVHIEDNIIKYAKVRKDKDLIKIESYNVIFYEDLRTTIKQILTETNSNKIPIAVNVSGEMYNYFQISELLSKQDMKKAVEIDFELLCEERKYNKATLENRFLFSPSIESEDRIQAIVISAPQGEIAQRKMDFGNIKVEYITPVSTSIVNLIEPGDDSNIVIVNIEERTKITVMSAGQIVKIDLINEGMKNIIDRISLIENSRQKAYDVCKNTTLYSTNGADSGYEDSEYVDSIIPTLSKIIDRTKETIEDSGLNISKIYITGLGSSINNIDLYFQDYFLKTKCEILKPYFANVASINTSIKDYIEVNSATALALNGLGLGYGEKELNFSSERKSITKGINLKSIFDFKGKLFKSGGRSSSGEQLEPSERLILRISITLLIAIVGYIIFASAISSKIDLKAENVENAMLEVQNQLNIANADLNKIQSQTAVYQKAIDEINSLEADNSNQVIIKKKAIPNLLYRFVSITPKKVQITSIENTQGTNRITIQAQSKDYEQLGFFKAAIATNGYLVNVKSTSGTKSGDVVSVVIEGDLP